MDLIELIFKLVEKFVPISQESLRKMFNEAQDWRMKLNDQSGNPVEKMYLKLMDLWYVRLALAIAYIPLVKYIMEIMNPEPESPAGLV